MKYFKTTKSNVVLILGMVFLLVVFLAYGSVPKNAPFETGTFCTMHGASTRDGVYVYILTPMVWNFPIKAKSGYQVRYDGNVSDKMTVPSTVPRDHKFAEILSKQQKVVARVYVH